MKYGVLTDQACRNLYKKINKRYKCEDCKKQRSEFSEKDRDGAACNNLLPGFSSEILKVPIDILIVAEAIGPHRTLDFQQKFDLENAISRLAEYYLVKDVQKFHQDRIRALLEYLNGKRLTWVFTDLIKCFVWQHSDKKQKNLKGSKNKKIAINHCRDYLDEQIRVLLPKRVLCLGGTVAKQYFRLKGKLKHGNIYHINSMGDHKFPLIHSTFPSGYTADIWIKNGGWINIFPKLDVAQ
jgi:hypothetical protein